MWDLNGDGSELWKATNVIASLAFHPDTRYHTNTLSFLIADARRLHFNSKKVHRVAGFPSVSAIINSLKVHSVYKSEVLSTALAI